ncbi:MAG: hypothetical protein U0N82_13010 [Oscillospiraceae bacterium]
MKRQTKKNTAIATATPNNTISRVTLPLKTIQTRKKSSSIRTLLFKDFHLLFITSILAFLLKNSSIFLVKMLKSADAYASALIVSATALSVQKLPYEKLPSWRFVIVFIGILLCQNF